MKKIAYIQSMFPIDDDPYPFLLYTGMVYFGAGKYTLVIQLENDTKGYSELEEDEHPEFLTLQVSTPGEVTENIDRVLDRLCVEVLRHEPFDSSILSGSEHHDDPPKYVSLQWANYIGVGESYLNNPEGVHYNPIWVGVLEEYDKYLK